MDNPGVFHCGDIMYDNSLHFSKLSDEQSSILKTNQLIKNKYVLSTIHRNDNTDQPERLSGIFEALLEIIEVHDTTIVLPLHPRTAKLLETNTTPGLYQKIKAETRLKIIEPVSFLDMIALEKNASLIVTDSGGVQKEAFFFEKPCIILRPETEWVELVSCGAADIVGFDKIKIVESFNKFHNNSQVKFPSLFGDGKAGEFMCRKMIESF